MTGQGFLQMALVPVKIIRVTEIGERDYTSMPTTVTRSISTMLVEDRHTTTYNLISLYICGKEQNETV